MKSVNWRSDELETRCSRRSQHPERLAPRPPRASLENEKDTTLTAIRVGVNMLQFCSVSNSLSHTNLSNKVRGIFFLKKSSLVFIHCVSMYSACICVYMHIYYCVVMILHVYVDESAYDYTTQRSSRCILQPQPSGQSY